MNKNMSMSSIMNTPKRIQSFFTTKSEGNNIVAKFQKNHSFEKRKSESFRILEEYPNRVPIICERVNNDIAELDRKKYLVPNDLTMCNFMYVIRKRLTVAPEVAIYLFVNTKIMPTSMTMDSIYHKHKHDDGFLYIYYSGESTFG